MHVITHALAGWCLAEWFPGLTRREKGWITVAAVLPDLDDLGVIAELATRDGPNPLYWYTDYHHVLAHNALFAVLVGLAAAMAARSGATGLLACIAVHLHIAGDLVGSRGPDGYSWPIPYLQPFADTEFVWSGPWRLNAWRTSITIALMALTIVWARQRGSSIVGLVSRKADLAFVEVLRRV